MVHQNFFATVWPSFCVTDTEVAPWLWRFLLVDVCASFCVLSHNGEALVWGCRVKELLRHSRGEWSVIETCFPGSSCSACSGSHTHLFFCLSQAFGSYWTKWHFSTAPISVEHTLIDCSRYDVSCRNVSWLLLSSNENEHFTEILWCLF